MKKVFNTTLIIATDNTKGYFSALSAISEILKEMIPESEPWAEVLSISLISDSHGTKVEFELSVENYELAADFIRNVKIAVNMRLRERQVVVKFYEIFVNSERV